ncbi:hypothetical protein GWK47_006353 [Chionoecetes opilio]|uniref:Uncharacterized protein n=1 Tax=Chionoecetes opilio TaxID=41210 RepID=A0A8J4YEM0_CHIOP|nr:hypothetical protein GWK47_006353 [Chionoecetes opilio]
MSSKGLAPPTPGWIQRKGDQGKSNGEGVPFREKARTIKRPPRKKDLGGNPPRPRGVLLPPWDNFPFANRGPWVVIKTFKCNTKGPCVRNTQGEGKRQHDDSHGFRGRAEGSGNKTPLFPKLNLLFAEKRFSRAPRVRTVTVLGGSGQERTARFVTLGGDGGVGTPFGAVQSFTFAGQTFPPLPPVTQWTRLFLVSPNRNGEKETRPSRNFSPQSYRCPRDRGRASELNASLGRRVRTVSATSKASYFHLLPHRQGQYHVMLHGHVLTPPLPVHYEESHDHRVTATTRTRLCASGPSSAPPASPRGRCHPFGPAGDYPPDLDRVLLSFIPMEEIKKGKELLCNLYKKTYHGGGTMNLKTQDLLDIIDLT